MKWTSRQLLLPILLGFSLTGVSIALVYLLYKKDEEDTNFRKSNIVVGQQSTLELKVPRKFVPAIIGRGGSMINKVQRKTGSRIHFEKDDIECSDRICVIKGTYECIQLAKEMINDIIEKQPIIETYEMYVPQSVCGKIIGRAGEVISQIQSSSSAKIIVERDHTPYDTNADRRIIIKGTAKQIVAALSQIEDKVSEAKKARINLEASSATRLPRGKLSPRSTAVNTTEHSQSTESPSLQVTDGVMEVFVSAMETPSQFWVQVVGPGATALDKLVSEMTAYYNEEENQELHALKNLTLGQIVAAKFSFDEQWYRARVISVPEDDQCEVYFVDYGDHDVVPLDSVFELRTDFLSLRLQAIECSLANVKARDNEWSTEACDKFAELTRLAQWSVLVAKIKGFKERLLDLGEGRSRRAGSPIPRVDLYDKTGNKDINVGQELINEGLAEPEEALLSAASSTLSLSTRSHDITTISSPASTSPLAKRALSPETRANDSSKLDSTLESLTDTPNTSDVILETTKPTTGRLRLEEVDLVTPQRSSDRIEEIDLVTPVKDETGRFIENEKKAQREDGGGDYLRNGNSSQQHGRTRDQPLKVGKSLRYAPAGYESDLSDNSDELELG